MSGEGQAGLAPRRLARRAVLAAAAALAGERAAEAAPPAGVRLGVLAFGTVRWVASVIRGHAFDLQAGIALKTETLANNEGGKVALLGGAVDVIVSDWLFVGAERARGLKLRFSPFSSATGALVRAGRSPIRSLKDLAGRRLGVAGGPYDKSWMIVRAAAKRAANIDLAEAANVVYAAPPLLNAKLEQGALDAVLTYWNFATALEVKGFPPLMSVSAAAVALGLPAHPPLVGYVFKEDWARRAPAAIEGFLAAAAAAEALLARSDAAWRAVRPLMNAPGKRLFIALRERFRAGIVAVDPAAEAEAAGKLFAILKAEGGVAATGGLARLPRGIFWPSPT